MPCRKRIVVQKNDNIFMFTDNNVCATEDTALLQMVSEGTKGEGCDLIINSVSGARRLVTYLFIILIELLYFVMIS